MTRDGASDAVTFHMPCTAPEHLKQVGRLTKTKNFNEQSSIVQPADWLACFPVAPGRRVSGRQNNCPPGTESV
jgi:hypothetical protein